MLKVYRHLVPPDSLAMTHEQDFRDILSLKETVMLKKLIVMMMVLGMSLPALAAAQDLPQAGAARGGDDDNVVYQKETVYDFDGDDITGNLVKPDGTNIRGDQRGKTSSLIDIRSDFIPEMLKTGETL